jgi:hypothetical protein
LERIDRSNVVQATDIDGFSVYNDGVRQLVVDGDVGIGKRTLERYDVLLASKCDEYRRNERVVVGMEFPDEDSNDSADIACQRIDRCCSTTDTELGSGYHSVLSPAGIDQFSVYDDGV